MVWIELFDRRKAPSSWGKASLEARNPYHSELEKCSSGKLENTFFYFFNFCTKK